MKKYFGMVLKLVNDKIIFIFEWPIPLREMCVSIILCELDWYSLISVGDFSQLVSSHSCREVVIIHDVLKVKIWKNIKLINSLEAEMLVEALYNIKTLFSMNQAQTEIKKMYTYIIKHLV